MSTGTKRGKVKKRRPNSVLKEISEGAHGLWIDREFLCRHMNLAPKFVHNNSADADHELERYLELADALLNTNGERHQRNRG